MSIFIQFDQVHRIHNKLMTCVSIVINESSLSDGRITFSPPFIVAHVKAVTKLYSHTFLFLLGWLLTCSTLFLLDAQTWMYLWHASITHVYVMRQDKMWYKRIFSTRLILNTEKIREVRTKEFDGSQFAQLGRFQFLQAFC